MTRSRHIKSQSHSWNTTMVKEPSAPRIWRTGWRSARPPRGLRMLLRSLMLATPLPFCASPPSINAASLSAVFAMCCPCFEARRSWDDEGSPSAARTSIRHRRTTGSVLTWKISPVESNGPKRSQMRRTQAALILSRKARERLFPGQQTTVNRQLFKDAKRLEHPVGDLTRAFVQHINGLTELNRGKNC